MHGIDLRLPIAASANFQADNRSVSFWDSLQRLSTTRVQVIVIQRTLRHHPKKPKCLRSRSSNPGQSGSEASAILRRQASRWQVAWRALAPSQFPALLQRPTDLAHRHLDAERGAVVAGLPVDWFGAAAGSVGFASQIPVFLFAPLGGITADRFNRRQIVIGTQVASMLLAFMLAVLTLSAQSSSLARVCARSFAGRGECVRYSRPPILSGGHGRQGRPDERHRSELFHVQRSARDRSGNRGNSGGEDRRRLVLLRQRGELYRGDYRVADDEGAEPGRAARWHRRSNT